MASAPRQISIPRTRIHAEFPRVSSPLTSQDNAIRRPLITRPPIRITDNATITSPPVRLNSRQVQRGTEQTSRRERDNTPHAMLDQSEKKSCGNDERQVIRPDNWMGKPR